MTSKALQLEGEHRNSLEGSSGPTLPLLALMLSDISFAPKLQRQVQRFLEQSPDLIEQPIKAADLFSLTTSALDHYGRVSQMGEAWLGAEMGLMFESFAGQFAGRPIEAFPLAAELAGVRRQQVSPYYGVEYALSAASRPIGLGREVMCQDILVFATGSADPKVVSQSRERARVIPAEPLFLFPAGKERYKVNDALERLTGAFADALESVRRPICCTARAAGADIEVNLPFQGHFSRLSGVTNDQWTPLPPRSESFDPFSISQFDFVTGEYGGPLVLNIYINHGSRGEYSQTLRCNLAVRGDRNGELTIPAGDFLLELYKVVESRFVGRIKNVQEVAGYCVEMFTEGVLSENPALKDDARKQEMVRRFGNWIYGTWVAGLLMLWREQVSDPTANYLIGPRQISDHTGWNYA